MADKNLQALDDAVARNTGIVLSLPSAGMLRHHKSRFLAGSPDGLWIESAHDDAVLIDELIARQQPAAVSFKAGMLRASFVSCIIRRDSGYRINADTVVEALLIQAPDQVKTVQRRSDYRVRIPDDGSLSARVWRIAEKAQLDRVPPAAQEIKGVLRDMSVGGLGITVPLETPAQQRKPEDGSKPEDVQPPVAEQKPEKLKLLPDERLRVEIRCGEQEPLLLEGRVRHLSPPVRGARVQSWSPSAVHASGVSIARRTAGSLASRPVTTPAAKMTSATR
jgi:hypothetical protein